MQASMSSSVPLRPRGLATSLPCCSTSYAQAPPLRVLRTRATSGSSQPSADTTEKRIAEAFSQAEQAAQRTWAKLDSEYSITDKGKRAAKKAEEALRDVDQSFNLRRRVRNSLEYVQRMRPVWQARLDEFATTWYGKATILLCLGVVISTPLFWRIVNVVLILWWLAIPFGAVMAAAAQRRAYEQAQRAAQEEAARRQRNPFADLFYGRTARTVRPSAGGAASASARRSEQQGPVVDAEFTVISDKK